MHRTEKKTANRLPENESRKRQYSNSNDKGNHTTFVTGHFKKRHQDN